MKLVKVRYTIQLRRKMSICLKNYCSINRMYNCKYKLFYKLFFIEWFSNNYFMHFLIVCWYFSYFLLLFSLIACPLRGFFCWERSFLIIKTIWIVYINCYRECITKFDGRCTISSSLQTFHLYSHQSSAKLKS